VNIFPVGELFERIYHHPRGELFEIVLIAALPFKTLAKQYLSYVLRTYPNDSCDICEIEIVVHYVNKKIYIIKQSEKHVLSAKS
jgi:hypothetical protein